jgi:RNA polymerase sigma-70 factor (ECF subfamily)
MAGNDQFTRYWTQAQPVVAGYISSLVPDFHAAEDLLQDVAVVLLHKFGEYDPQRPFVAWALGIARLEVLSKRRQSTIRSVVGSDSQLIESVTAAYEELAPELDLRAHALRECRKEVRGRAETVLKLRYENALKPADIAAKLGLEPGAVRVQLSRIRSALQECVQRRLAMTERRV